MRRDRIPFVISVSLVLEYEDVTSRPGMIPSIPYAAVTRFLDALVALAEHQNVYFTWRPFLKDPKDDMILELVAAASASHIVTFNRKDFVGAEQFGLMISTPAEILAQRGEI